MKTALIIATALAIVAVSFAAPSTKEVCKRGAELFVKQYNERGGDKYVKELDQVLGCWFVADDMHLSIVMKTGKGYWKACSNVIYSTVDREATEIKSTGTCRFKS